MNFLKNLLFDDEIILESGWNNSYERRDIYKLKQAHYSGKLLKMRAKDGSEYNLKPVSLDPEGTCFAINKDVVLCCSGTSINIRVKHGTSLKDPVNPRDDEKLEHKAAWYVMAHNIELDYVYTHVLSINKLVSWSQMVLSGILGAALSKMI